MRLGLVESDHQFREAYAQRGIVDLGGRRIDARTSSLESLATQATLLAGFSYAVLSPEAIDVLLGEDNNNSLVATLTACCSAISFASATWVIYMCMYASIRSQLISLLGVSAAAVTTSLDVLLTTTERAMYYFDVSLLFLGLSACTVVWAHLPFPTALAVNLFFLVFIYDGFVFKRAIDGSFERWSSPKRLRLDGEALSMPEMLKSSVSVFIGRTAKLWKVQDPASAGNDEGDVRSTDLGNALEPRGRAYQVLEENRHLSKLSSADLPRTTARQEEEGAHMERNSLVPTRLALAEEGWMYKGTSSEGPLGPNDQRLMTPRDRRFFVLRGCELKWFRSEADAILNYRPRQTVNLTRYCVRREAEAGVANMLSLIPKDIAEPSQSSNSISSALRMGANGKKSWYFRAFDSDSFERWYGLLSLACNVEVPTEEPSEMGDDE